MKFLGLLNPHRNTIATCFGACGKDLLNLIIHYYFIFVLISFYHFKFSSVIFIIACIKFIEALLNPILGFIIESASNSLGKYRKNATIGTVLTALLSLFLLQDYSFTQYYFFYYFVFIFFLWNIAIDYISISFWASLWSFGSKSKEREKIVSFSHLFNLIGIQISCIILYYLNTEYSFLAFLPLVDYAYFIVTIFIFFMLCWLLLLNLKPSITDTKYDIKNLFSSIFKNDQLWYSFVTRVLIYLAISLFSVSLFLKFSKLTIADNGYYFILIEISAITQFVGFTYFSELTSIVSRRLIFSISCITMILGFVLMYFIDLQQIESFNIYILTVIIASLGISMTVASTTTMALDTIDYGEFKTTFRMESISMGFMCLAFNISLCSAILLPNWLLTFKDYGLSSINTGFKICLLIASSCTFLALIIYKKYYKLNGFFFNKVLSTLEDMRSKHKSSQIEQNLLRYALDENAILIRPNNLKSMDELLRIMVNKFYENNVVSDPLAFMHALEQKAKVQPFGIAEGIAIAHAKHECVQRAGVALTVLDKAVDCGAIDGKPCDLIFLLASPIDDHTHLNLLGSLSLVLNTDGFANSLRLSDSPLEIVERIVSKSY